MPTDPYYRSAPARWLRENTTWRTGLEVVCDPHLEGTLTGRIERAAQLFRIPPNLDLETLLYACSHTVMHELFGSGTVSGFKPVHLTWPGSLDQANPPDPG